MPGRSGVGDWAVLEDLAVRVAMVGAEDSAVPGEKGVQAVLEGSVRVVACMSLMGRSRC
ncbi:MAG: hypothetical protein ACHRXM_09885 [Isosphaerales bacterium]